ncbi:unnamed protein product [Symbiodinium microadriaticum]|nr:unnamed protein product [Symbiodinium sp. KB8]CAE7239438.1 unnamed protein product [Symbiodinium microadriaticum]
MQQGLCQARAAAVAAAALAALPSRDDACSPSEVSLASQRLRFIWVLLPEFLERPTSVAAAAGASRAMQSFLSEQKKLRVSHLSLHPNSLMLEGDHSMHSLRPALTGCLTKVTLDSLVSVQFHMPRLLDVLALLEGFACSSCRCLRKVVDRQSRWRPRELRFELMEEDQRLYAATVADLLGSLPALQHLEGPIFSVLLRARRHAAVAARAEAATSASSAQDRGEPKAQSMPAASSTRAPCLPIVGRHIGSGLRVLHLVDLCAADLSGLLPHGAIPEGYSQHSASNPSCPNLHKLLLLNLPAAAPGLTVQVVEKFLSHAPDLKELQLDFQYFDPGFWDLEALEALVARIQVTSKISKLVLDWCRLGDAGVRCVCAALAKHTSNFCLAGNHIGDGLCREKCVESKTGVKELSLAHCELKDLTSVCEMLETPGLALTSLDLSANGFGDEEGLKLARSLQLSSIKELRLRDSQVSERMPVKTKWSWSS